MTYDEALEALKATEKDAWFSDCPELNIHSNLIQAILVGLAVEVYIKERKEERSAKANL